ncbi:MAG: hypothetical protein ACHQF2_05175 [Flavobacteriales bacterium]
MKTIQPYRIGLIAVLTVLFVSDAFPQSQGPFNPGTITTGACTFSYSSVLAYSPTGNVATSNNAYASVTHCNCCDANTNCLKVSNFGFTIPLTATITGITVRIEKRASAGAIIQDNGLMLVKAGVEVGSSLATAANWPFSDTYVVYGGCSNLWGTTWTPAEINAVGFGCFFAAIDYSCTGNTQSFIDNIQITVCYLATLPVELNRFEAVIENNAAALSWETLSETNNHEFIIERSSDGVEFEELSRVKGAGTSTEVHNYTFIDRTILTGFNYYRLLQQDVNGAVVACGNVQVVEWVKPFSPQVISWNENGLAIRLFSENNQALEVSLVTVQGTRVGKQSVILQKGINDVNLLFYTQYPGMYILSLQLLNTVPVTLKLFYLNSSGYK